VAVADEVRATIQQLYGYPDPPLIPNGIPTDEYAPDPDKRVQWRQAHGIEPHATVLVHVGRFAPPKNHALLIEAFAQVRSDAPLYLLLVGGASWRMPCASRSLRWACTRYLLHSLDIGFTWSQLVCSYIHAASENLERQRVLSSATAAWKTVRIPRVDFSPSRALGGACRPRQAFA
jgi:glycosyltransferase involved in cell wall biosynthesis